MSLDGPKFDFQIAGVQDDGTAEGIVRAKVLSGELVRVRFLDLEVFTSTTGSASNAFSRSTYGNGDHSGYGINMIAPAGAGNLSSTSVTMWGNSVGVRFRRPAPAFSLIVDGQPYEVSLFSRQFSTDNLSQSPSIFSKEGVFVVGDLGTGPHSVSVVLYPDLSVSKTLVLYGLVGERAAGYEQSAPLDTIHGTGQLTNVAADVLNTDSSGVPNAGVKSVLYYNTSAVTRTVQVLWNSVVIWEAVLAAAGASGSSATFSASAAGLMPGASPKLQHKADTVAVVNYAVMGAA